ncbi:putative DNA-binding protein [Weissella kandleri]|uniref:putative DNA-binding protein n=1 Tax=Weissella kandleri TaxID=1616 RepID=UPI00387E6194
MELEKTNRLNILFASYRALLTKKQDAYLSLYYEEDNSLGEIAEEFNVSRQAVYDNLKRSTQALENYEAKLHIYQNYLERQTTLTALQAYVAQNYSQDQTLNNLVRGLAVQEEEN